MNINGTAEVNVTTEKAAIFVYKCSTSVLKLTLSYSVKNKYGTKLLIYTFLYINLMPSKKGSKKLVAKQSLLGIIQKNKKFLSIMEDKISEQELSLQRLSVVYSEDEAALKDLRKKIDNQRRQLRHKRSTFRTLQVENSIRDRGISRNDKDSSSFSLSSLTSRKRKAKPTTSELNLKAKQVRRNETITACNLIHGSSKESAEPGLVGMLDTLTSKFKSKELSTKILSSKKSLVTEIKNVTVMNWGKDYSNSEENTLRSLNVYYSHNVMGKRKYNNVRKANKVSSYQNVKVPNYIPYTKLSETINSVDIGAITDVNELSPNSQVRHQGAYRKTVDYVLRLAKFYHHVNKKRKDELMEFESLPRKCEQSFLFVLLIGGDGAPGSGAFLVSFLNCGKRIASSAENYILFGANVDETSDIVKLYLKELVADLYYLESKVFEVDGVKVEFMVGGLPNDMKMLSFLAGELSNSSTHFLTFANVCQKESNNYKKSFGLFEGSYWKPWKYENRLADAEKVNEKKRSVKNLSRNNITSFISNTLKSRQEFTPLIAKFINVAKAEPLHLKNNTIKEQFMKLFKICLAKTNLGKAKSYSEIPQESLFVQFVEFIHSQMNCNFLSKKIQRWFNDNSGKTERDFAFRFRGKESFNFMQSFPELIMMIFTNVTQADLKQRLAQIHYQCILLRKLLSFSVRVVDFDENLLQEMILTGTRLFKATCIFNQRISPSLWTLCNAAPIHAKICFEKYNLGLGCNTMEGREQKHQSIAKYAENTTFQNRWSLIFRH